MKLAKLFGLISFIIIGASVAQGQLAAVSGDQRPADVEAIRAHLDKIFQGFIHQDAAALRATHAAEWRGFMEGSRVVRKGLEQYMQGVSGALKSPQHMLSYKILDFDVMFYGDIALVPYVAEVVEGDANHSETEKLRILDVFAKLNGDWIEVATNTAQHPDSIERGMTEPQPLDAETKKSLRDARESVWRSFFAGDQSALAKLIPAETIGINANAENWDNREAILAAAKGFAESGTKVTRLEFPKTEAQLYGACAILYSTYLYETEAQGKREAHSGRATEMFVFRDGHWVNVGWHLDSGR